jgi:nicotinamidase-related amidase
MLSLDASKTALLVMDLQSEIVPMLGDKGAALVERAAGVVAAARRGRLPIIYVAVGFRPGYPEINPSNAAFAGAAKTGRFQTLTPDIVPALAPQAADVLVVKHRVNAFAATDLDMILRAKGVDTLLLLGVSTSGVVLSTLRHAADADYKPVVVADCCADGDDEVHRVLTEKVFPKQATVVNASELHEALPKS